MRKGKRWRMIGGITRMFEFRNAPRTHHVRKDKRQVEEAKIAASTSRGVNTWIIEGNRETFLPKMDHLSKSSRVEKDVDRLGDISCMQVVVVLDLLQVVVLQGHQEAEQGGGRDLEGAQEVSLLQDPEQKVEGQL